MRHWTIAVGALALASCTTAGGGLGAPAGSGAAGQAITPSEKAQGAKAHPDILAEFGGAYSAPQTGYVVRTGQKIAVQSGLSNAGSDFTVTLLNSPVNNAFAIPGGYVYITRQLVALANDEAEMAGVLGHEVGHVAARHSAQRQAAATRNSIIGLLGSVAGGLLGDSGGVGGLLGGALQRYSGTVAQLFTLRYSRGQEEQADDLGIRYLSSAGYDPQALSSMLASLAAQNAVDVRAAGNDQRSVPEWASTHPEPARRVSRAAGVAANFPAGGLRNRDTHLAAIDGLLYGDDPKQGVIEGNRFVHPDLRLQFAVPAGYGMSNGAQAVTISGQGGQAQFGTGSYAGNLETYVGTVFRSLSQSQTVNFGTVRRTTINGIPAATASARASTQGGQVDVTVVAYEFARDRAYHFVALTPVGSNPFGAMFDSVRRLSAAEAAAVRPRRLSVVTVAAGDTVAGLSRRMAYDSLQTERFLALNGLSVNAPLQRGQKVKLVTY